MTDLDLNRLARKWARKLGDRRELRVVWNPRMRSLAGTAEFAARAIELNERLLRRRPKETLSTLAHEVCHLVAGARAGHGERWTAAMERLGFPPECEHTLDVSHLMHRRRRWVWHCLRCRERLVRCHTGVHLFRCACGGRLVVKGGAERPPHAARRARPASAAAAPARTTKRVRRSASVTPSR